MSQVGFPKIINSHLKISNVFFNMPRRYTKRTVIIRKPRVKWSPHMEAHSDELLISGNTQSVAIAIAANNSDSHIPTVPVVQVTRINVQAQLGSGQLPGMDWYAYLMFVPENTTLASTSQWLSYIYAHPEYLMARKIVESDNASDNTSVALNMSTRLKRNLNSGDTIYLFLVARVIGSVSGSKTLPIHAEISYYSKVN